MFAPPAPAPTLFTFFKAGVGAWAKCTRVSKMPSSAGVFWIFLQARYNGTSETLIPKRLCTLAPMWGSPAVPCLRCKAHYLQPYGRTHRVYMCRKIILF